MSEKTRRWRIGAIGEMVFSNEEEITNGYWIGIQLQWIQHGSIMIDVADVDWHITLGHFICNVGQLEILTPRINRLWKEWLIFDLVINERTSMDPAGCIMWEFNTSPQAVSNCSVLVQSEQIIDACYKAYLPHYLNGRIPERESFMQA